MKKYAFLLLLLTVFSLIYSPEDPSQAFEGQWSTRNEPGSGGPDFYLNYSFQDGRYSFEGYPPISEAGSYEVISFEEDSFSKDYVLYLSPKKGDPLPENPYLLQIKINSENQMSLGLMYGTSNGYVFQQSEGE